MAVRAANAAAARWTSLRHVGAGGAALASSMNLHLGDCQNCGPFLGPHYTTGPITGPNLGEPKRDRNFDNPPLRLDTAPTQ